MVRRTAQGRDRMRRRAGWALAAVGSAGCGQGVEPPPRPSSIRFVGGATATDTIGAVLPQALVIEVPDAPAGTVVQFENGALLGPVADVLVGRIGSEAFAPSIADTLRTSTRASIQIKLGGQIGRGMVVVSVAEFGIRDSATYTVMPGRVALVRVAPRDTAVFPGASLRLTAATYDRIGHPVVDQVDFAGPDPNVTIAADLGRSATQRRRRTRSNSIPNTRPTARGSTSPAGTPPGSRFIGSILTAPAIRPSSHCPTATLPPRRRRMVGASPTRSSAPTSSGFTTC